MGNLHHIKQIDGSFEGSYHDSDMGFVGEGYPHGTVYICEFSGTFNNIQQIDDNTYAYDTQERNHRTRKYRK
ncbi:MAG: hypothetical protein V8Q17_01855 [Acutalibacteraceae bacterium]